MPSTGTRARRSTTLGADLLPGHRRSARSLDHLEVLIDGYIDANALNRLGSVPIERITRATNLQVIAKHEAGDGGLAITLEGGLSDGDGSPYSPPSADELKELLEDHPTWWR